ncbi:hypothetical protein AUC43_09550 [Hymenobacter sedentarius]|uniref:Uncharacterized protein n=1 Tax=Hymenobacter sedentarius TaxID=1411621 RepID=A0A0U3SGM7_9BACT|nr:hypothetical protein [Hymenobacter sedentarius]ALW85318.1 hypothetical protein AUC43_09550 [Hymenobacter sedentarius]
MLRGFRPEATVFFPLANFYNEAASVDQGSVVEMHCRFSQFTIPSNPNARGNLRLELVPMRKALTLAQIAELRNFYMARGMDGWARAYDRMRTDFKLTEHQAREKVKAVRSEEQFKQLNRILHQAQLDH